MKCQNVLKRTLAGVLSVLTVAGTLPANVGTGGLFGGATIVANAEGEQYVFWFENKSRIQSITITGADDEEFVVNLSRSSQTDVFEGDKVTLVATSPMYFGDELEVEETYSEGLYTYEFYVHGYVAVQPEAYDIDNWVGATVDADENFDGKYYPGDTITITTKDYNDGESDISGRVNIGYWDDNEIWHELTETSDYADGVWTSTFVMPRNNTVIKGYVHEHQYEYTVDGPKVIRTCTVEDDSRNDDCESTVVAFIANDWNDNGAAYSDSVTFNPFGTVGVYYAAWNEDSQQNEGIGEWPEGTWIDFYEIDEDGNETKFDYYDRDVTPVGKYKAVGHYHAPNGEDYAPTLEFEVTPFEVYSWNFTAYNSGYTTVGGQRVESKDDWTASATYKTYNTNENWLNINGMIDWSWYDEENDVYYDGNKHWFEEDVDYEVLGRVISKGVSANTTVIRMIGNYTGEITVNWNVELPEKQDPFISLTGWGDGEDPIYQEIEDPETGDTYQEVTGYTDIDYREWSYGDFTVGTFHEAVQFNDHFDYWGTGYDGNPERLSNEDVSYEYKAEGEEEWIALPEDYDYVFPVGTYHIRAVVNENDYFNSGYSANTGTITIVPREIYVHLVNQYVPFEVVTADKSVGADALNAYLKENNSYALGNVLEGDTVNATDVNFRFEFNGYDLQDYLENEYDGEIWRGSWTQVYLNGEVEIDDPNYRVTSSNGDYLGDICFQAGKQLTDAVITESYLFTGEYIKPAITVVYGEEGEELTLGKDYRLRGDKQAKDVGEYTIYVEGAGDYEGSQNIVLNWSILEKPEAELTTLNNVTFAESVALNFYADMADEYVDGAYVKFTYDHYGEPAELTVDADPTKMTSGHYKFACPLQIPEMAVEVKAELYVPGYDMPVSETTTSIKAYCERMIARDTTSEKTKNALIATLNFGGYSQISTDKNNSAELLANKDLDPEFQDVSEVVVESGNTFTAPTEDVGGVHYAGATLMLRDSVSVRYYFTVDSLTNVKFTINGVEKTPVRNGSMYYIEADTIKSYDLDSKNTVVVTTADGEMTFTHTALNYAQTQSLRTTSNATAMKAMYAYYKAVRAYANMD